MTLKQSGVTVYSVAENTPAEIKKGTYTVTGSVSKYTKTLTIKADGTYNAYPDGMVLYWYGRFGDGFDAYGLNVQSSGTITKNENYLYSDTAQSKYGAIAFTPKVARGSYTTLKVDCQCDTPTVGQAAIGLSTAVTSGSQWDSNMVSGGYVQATTQSRKLYTVDISSVSSTTEYTVQIRSYSNSVSCWAAWLEEENGTEETEPEGELTSLDTSISINDTYRYCNALSTSSFTRVGSLGGSLQDINYVGQGTEDYNAMLVPVPAFSFSGTFKKLAVSLYLWTSTANNHTFRWAVTNSRDNEELYKGDGTVNDDNQLAAGSFTPPYSNSYQWYTIDITDCNIPSGAPLYLYFWRDNTSYGNIHVMDTVKITLQYYLVK